MIAIALKVGFIVRVVNTSQGSCNYHNEIISVLRPGSLLQILLTCSRSSLL